MDNIEAVKGKAKEFYNEWVRLSSMENKAPTNLTTISDLPFYNNQKVDLPKYTFVEDSPNLLQDYFKVTRYAVRDQYSLISERFETVEKFGKCVKKHYYNAKEYIGKEGTVVPKAFAITLGGMAGFIIGVKKYGIKKFAYATAGIATMTAFCYPEQTLDVCRTGYYHLLTQYEKIKENSRK
uniref:MICOS complex subunit n=1 Tax=Strongyloides papillosus TaxID=174720 RepID=A0A0N5CE84_STREA